MSIYLFFRRTFLLVGTLLFLGSEVFDTATAFSGGNNQKRPTIAATNGLPDDNNRIGKNNSYHKNNVDAAAATDSSSSPPEGFYMEHNVVSEETWKILKHWLDTGEFRMPNTTQIQKAPIPWQMGAQNRRVAQFGFRYNYESSNVEFDDDIPPIPFPLQQLLLETTCIKNLFQQQNNQWTQCIINVYEENVIIPWHWDHVDFGPVVLVFTFGEERPLQLRRLKSSTPSKLPSTQCHYDPDSYAEDDYDYFTAYPRHCSCYILSDRVRYHWEHGVPPGSGQRVSITFRTHKDDYPNDTV